ncbi:MAG: hypothetical protein H6757_03450 [Candidatus Omnitrophica bacterium]|nr:hypothetical protein [Candidatus Omnitrophota bacterium]
MVTKFHRIGDHVDFREISLCRTLFITASFMLLIFLIDDLTVKILISSLFFLVFGDLVNLLYFNTLYLEFSVIAGCFLSLSAAVWLMASSKRPSWPMMVFSMSALSWLGLSKQQYMPFAALLSVFLSVSIFLRWKNKRMTFAFVLLALLLPLGYERFNPNSTGIMKKVNFANKTDTFLGAVLEAADDRKGALSILGLSDTCMEGIGKNWYSPGIQQNHPCPQIETLSRVRLFRLFILQPSTFFKPMYKALIRICPFYSNRLGHLERPADRESGRYGLFKITSFSNLLVALPRPMYFWMIVISMISWPVFMFLAIRGDQPMKKNSEHYRLMFTMLSLGGLTVFYAVVSSVFGDGYADISKHTVVLINGMIFQVGAVGLKLFPHKV